MAGRGPVADENSKRTELRGGTRALTGPVDAPKLPNRENYSQATIAWYDTWCTSAQASEFTATEWMRLHMLAPLIEKYFQEPTQQLMAEIRLNEAKLGATPEDRQRLRWKIADVGPDEKGDKPTASRARKDPRKT